MDQLTLKGLYFKAPHGYHEEERLKENEFEVDVMVTADLSGCTREDDLTRTINYERLHEAVTEVMQGRPVRLIETLAARIGEQIMHREARIAELEVRVRKLDPPFNTPCNYSEIRSRWPK